MNTSHDVSVPARDDGTDGPFLNTLKAHQVADRIAALQRDFHHVSTKFSDAALKAELFPGFGPRLLADAYDAGCKFGLQTKETGPGRRIIRLQCQPNTAQDAIYVELEVNLVPEVNTGPVLRTIRIGPEGGSQHLSVHHADVLIHPSVTAAHLRDGLSRLDRAMNDGQGFFRHGWLERQDIYSHQAAGKLPVTQLFAEPGMEICVAEPRNTSDVSAEWLLLNRFDRPDLLEVTHDPESHEASIHLKSSASAAARSADHS